MDKIGFGGFFRSRLIRLHPLVILGSVLGLITFLLDPYSIAAESYGGLEILLLFVSSILLIPAPVMEERAFNLFSFNAPSWSLFWEYVANIAYAFALYKIGRRSLLLLTILAAIMLSFVAYDAGNLLGGWTRDNFWDGAARVAYSFLAGMVIFRYNLIIRNNLGFAVIGLLLFMAFLFPWTDFNWISELLIVLIYFPLLVSLGAGSSLAPGFKKLCEFSGDISYPLYMTHYCAIWIFGNYYLMVKPPMDQVYYLIILGVMFLVAFAYLVMRFFDIPVRRYLNEKRRRASEL